MRKRTYVRRKPSTPDPLWFKSAIVYELLVRAFSDSNADGIGDFVGLTSKLDYLEDLGVNALWLLPFYPSPLRDGGYDIADYKDIHPAYGSLTDFKRFLAEAHARGIRVITELVINHTSAEHAWFQRARRAPPGSAARDFYVWSDTPERYAKARIIFQDFEASNWSWDPVAKAYYFHRFYAHQPDLNFDNPAVHEAVHDVLDFWLDLGVDGVRLDAVPYLYEREGTSCENLPETHAFLRKLRAHVDAKHQDRMLLAEANQWPADAAAYFGDGDECHMNFHFPLMPRMFMAVQMEDRFPIVDILRQTPRIPPSCQWATFLRNHDELTLEMVTDEDRDYMYRAYTEDPVARINLGIRRRLAPLLRSRRRIELMTALLFSLPGTPVLYYGDEIGMGDNVYLGDRDGVRTPMQWSADRNAGFSRANPQRLYLPVIIDPEHHYEATNVEAQQSNPSSLLWWIKRLIAARKQHPVFGHGDIEILYPDNPKVLAFARVRGEEQVLVAANLSKHPQHAELDLRALAGKVPVEIFGLSRFPVITDEPYTLTFAPHSFYWFSLEPAAATTHPPAPLTATHTWTSVTEAPTALARALCHYAAGRRWFRGKGRKIRTSRIVDVVAAGQAASRCLFVLFEADYAEGEPETYVVPVSFAAGEAATHLGHRHPDAVIVALEVTGGDPPSGILYDAFAAGDAARLVLQLARSRGAVPGTHGRLAGTSSKALRERSDDEPSSIRAPQLEQTNSTAQVGDRAVIKLVRQVESGPNAELELGAYFAEHAPSARVARVLGSLTYKRPTGDPAAIAIVSAFVPNEGLAWDLFTSDLESLFERVLSLTEEAPPPAPVSTGLGGEPVVPPPVLGAIAGQHLRWARQLGVVTAEVHVALARGTSPDFEPEPFTQLYQQSLYQRARSLFVRTIEGLERTVHLLPEDVSTVVRDLLDSRADVDRQLSRILEPIDTVRIRCHGDLHLGQVLFTGDDFVIIDFEGEPARPLMERRYKRNALRDVAGMLRSFSYVAEQSLRGGRQRAQDHPRLRPWAHSWASWISATFLEGYLTGIGSGPFVPRSAAVRRLLLDFYSMEKCVYEIGYELGLRPAWLPIPVRGLLDRITR